MRGMGRIFKRGGVWWVSYYHRGKEHRESSNSSKEADAKRLLRKRLGEIHSKKFVGPQEERVAYSELEALLLQDYSVRGLRSLDTTRYRLKHLQEYFGEDRATDITPGRIRAYQSSRLEEGAQPATINRELAALRRMFRLAVKAGVLTSSPNFPESITESGPRQGFFEHWEYLAIRQHLPSEYQDVLDFAYYSGWRKKEITDLQWREVDLPGGLVRLSAERSKTREGRVLPLSGPLADVLARRQAARRLDTPLVFHRDGKAIRDWRKTWDRACRLAGLPGRRLHDCRRTVARNLVRAGVPERVAMEMTGHRTRSVFDRYHIVNEADLREAGAKLAAYVAGQKAEPDVVPLSKKRKTGAD